MYIYIYIYIKESFAAKVNGFSPLMIIANIINYSNDFLKMKLKETQINVTFFMTKDKSLEIYIGESTVKSGRCKKLLDIKIDSKHHV